MRTTLKLLLIGSCFAFSANVSCAQTPKSNSTLEKKLQSVNSQVITWRRDIHQHPELGNREFRTSKLVADHLKSLGLEVRTDIAKTGVVGVLRGAKPGPVIALRADMDALPIKEATGRSFASKAVTTYDGVENVPVMHACGHDAHTAMLMGAASVLARMKPEIHGTIIFVFQPAEEGAPDGETGGAERMMKEGVFKGMKPEAMFALHVEPGPVGLIDVRQKGFLAGATGFTIKLSGEGTHAARPWKGDDLVNLSADIVKGLATLTSRQINVLEEPSVVSVGAMQAGNRGNVLPSEAVLKGTLRTYSPERTKDLKAKVKTLVQSMAKLYGVKAEIRYGGITPPTVNDPKLVTRILPALHAAAGKAGVNSNATPRSAAEDFSFFAQTIPSVYYILGSTRNFTDYASAPGNHSQNFDIDEDVLAVGVKSHVMVALEYAKEQGIREKAGPIKKETRQ